MLGPLTHVHQCVSGDDVPSVIVLSFLKWYSVEGTVPSSGKMRNPRLGRVQNGDYEGNASTNTRPYESLLVA